MRLKFSGTAGEYPVVPATGGNVPDYRVRLEDVQEGLSRETNKGMISCRAIIVGGEYDGVGLPHQWSTQEQAIWRLEQDMWGLGLISDDRRGKPFELESAEVVAVLNGIEAFATVYTDNYKGQDRSKVGSLRSIESAAKPAPAPAPSPAPTKSKKPF